MHIRKSTENDYQNILKIYAHARTFMAEHGNPSQWGTNKPSPEQVFQDIKDGCSYLCEENGEILTVFFHKIGDDPTYTKIYEGSWPELESGKQTYPYGVVHRIASSGKRKGSASFCLNWALEQCGCLRIDTHRDNIVMQNLLKKNGFKYCGIICLEDGDPRLAYQKSL